MRALLFGMGGIGQRHLRNLKELHPEIEVGAYRVKNRVFQICADLSADYETDVCKKYGVRSFHTIEDALGFAPDLAIVANPTSCHVEIATHLVEAGIPVLLEKPISNRWVDAERLAELANKKHVPVAVGYMMRYHFCAIRLKKLLEEGAVGQLHSAALTVHSYVPDWHPYERCDEFYAGSHRLGGGVVLTENHELDLMHWYFGSPRRLWALGGKQSVLPIDVDDTAIVLMEFSHKDRWFPVSMNLSFVQKSLTRNMILYGDKGWIEWDISNSRMVVHDVVRNRQEICEDPDFQRNDLFKAELDNFLDCVVSGKPLAAPLQEVLLVQKTLVRIREALDSKTCTSSESCGPEVT
jgi:predicted dehydrogenase